MKSERRVSHQVKLEQWGEHMHGLCPCGQQKLFFKIINDDEDFVGDRGFRLQAARSLPAVQSAFCEICRSNVDANALPGSGEYLLKRSIPIYSSRLQQAISVGMVVLRVEGENRYARILAPPNPETLTDDDWLNLVNAASELRKELELLGFEVSG